MEGMRGLAVLLVFFVHYYWAFKFLLTGSPLLSSAGYHLAAIGHAGVDIFFVMSGYLIYAAALKPRLAYGKFMRRRVERIYPTFLVVLAIYIGISYAFPERSRIPADSASAVVYIIQNLALLPGIFPIIPIITPAWSLSYEFLYYLLAPALTRLTGMCEWTSGQRIAFIGAMATVYMALSAAGWAPHARMVIFSAGMILYEVTNRRRTPLTLGSRGEKAAILSFLVCLALSGYLMERSLAGIWKYHGIVDTFRALMLAASTAVLALYSFQFDGILRRLFSWQPLRYWGNMSYSYYLLHGLLIHLLGLFVSRNIHSATVFWALLPLALAFSIAGSAVLYLLVERQFSLRPHAVTKASAVGAGGAS
jgi:peptidoglycan/LPS O-acetylase OafA/YrhL